MQGLNDTFRRFTAMLEERLAGAIESTQGAVKAATIKRSTASSSIDGELAALQQMSGKLAEIRADLAGISIQDDGLDQA